MGDTTPKVRLTAEQKIAQLEQEIADRKAKAEAKAQAEAGAKKFQLEQTEAKLETLEARHTDLLGWFDSNGIDPDTVTAVAPVKKDAPAADAPKV